MARSNRIFKLSAAVDWEELCLHLPCPAGEWHQPLFTKTTERQASRVQGLQEASCPFFNALICSTGHKQLGREQWSHLYAKNLEKKAAADPRDRRAGWATGSTCTGVLHEKVQINRFVSVWVHFPALHDILQYLYKSRAVKGYKWRFSPGETVSLTRLDSFTHCYDTVHAWTHMYARIYACTNCHLWSLSLRFVI